MRYRVKLGTIPAGIVSTKLALMAGQYLFFRERRHQQSELRRAEPKYCRGEGWNRVRVAEISEDVLFLELF